MRSFCKKKNEQQRDAEEDKLKEHDRTFTIGTKGESKKDKLLISFDVLKNDFKKNEFSIAKTVAIMFEIDVETAVDVWSYLLF